MKKIIALLTAAGLALSGAAVLPEGDIISDAVMTANAEDTQSAEFQDFFEGNNTKRRTREEIFSYIDSHIYNISDKETYADVPNTASTYKSGVLSDASIKRATDVLNTMRFIAGLDEVSTTDDYNKLAQAGSMLNAANNSLNHFPPKPSDMSDDIYDLGYLGCRSSNLAMGYSNLPGSIMWGWMDDSDTYNRDCIGHRRWCLNPAMNYTGFGFTKYYSAMFCFDQSGSSSDYMVAWPAPVMPTMYFDTNEVWSFSKNTDFSEDTQVTLTRKRDSKKWNFSINGSDGYFSINNDNYGQPGCVIFKPDDIDYYGVDTFTVEITDDDFALAYDVEFICEHSYLELVQKQPTCTDSGETDFFCHLCGHKYSETVPKTGHKYTSKVVKPTYDSNGYTEHTCSVCGSSYKDDYTAKLVRKNISDSSISGISNKTYTGSAIKPIPTVTINGKTLTNGTDYTVSYKNNTNVGTATVTITGKGGYTGTVSKTFKIKAASVAKADISGIKNKAYTTKTITQSPTVKVGGRTLKKGTDFTLTYKNNKAVGTATVTITGKGNYSGSIKKTFKITKASVAKAKVTGISKRYKYTGKAIKPAVKTVKLGNVTLKKGRDYTVSYKNNKKAGTATVIITGKGSYKGTVKKTFKILSAQDYKMWQYTKQVVTLVNKERTKCGLKELKLNEKLYDKAMIRSKEITKYFAHTRPDGTDCFTVIEGIDCWTAGENIAAGQRTPQEVVTAWMNSPGHRANILNGSFTDIGVGLVYNASLPYGYYWTQIFIGK